MLIENYYSRTIVDITAAITASWTRLDCMRTRAWSLIGETSSQSFCTWLSWLHTHTQTFANYYNPPTLTRAQVNDLKDMQMFIFHIVHTLYIIILNQLADNLSKKDIKWLTPFVQYILKPHPQLINGQLVIYTHSMCITSWPLIEFPKNLHWQKIYIYCMHDNISIKMIRFNL